MPKKNKIPPPTNFVIEICWTRRSLSGTDRSNSASCQTSTLPGTVAFVQDVIRAVPPLPVNKNRFVWFASISNVAAKQVSTTLRSTAQGGHHVAVLEQERH